MPLGESSRHINWSAFRRGAQTETAVGKSLVSMVFQEAKTKIVSVGMALRCEHLLSQCGCSFKTCILQSTAQAKR